MPEATTQKNFFRLNGGLNTEEHELNFPDGFTTDEANYELLKDGSRRRRKGLNDEASAGADKTVATVAVTQAHTSFVWRNVGGDPTKAFIVHQIGDVLYFTDDAEIISTTYHADTINLQSYSSEATPTAANYRDNPVSFSSGRGHLFISGPYLYPHYISYDSVLDAFSSNRIKFQIRDFEGIDDGIAVDFEPTGTIDPDHRYNLRNVGWKQDDMDTYFSGASKHPSTNSLWYKGYKRTYGASVAEKDGDRAFNTTKMDAEVFGNASAPKGSLFLDPFDTTAAATVAGAGAALDITTWSKSGSTITVTTSSAHGFSNGQDVTISGNAYWYWAAGDTELLDDSLDGTHTIANVTSTTFEITKGFYSFSSWEDQFWKLGAVGASAALANSEGSVVETGPAAVEFHQGRVFLAGMYDPQWADHIFFSTIAQKATAYSKMHQVQDPTDETFSSLLPDDGGVIVIEGMSRVNDMISVRNSLLIFAEGGVWEISGGQRGVFTADGYSVRKITDNGCNSSRSPIKIDGGAFYTGVAGIFILSPNRFTGLLEANNVSEDRVQTLWNQIPEQEQTNLQSTYDESLRRVYMLYGATDADNINDTMLIFDMKIGAYYKYTFTVATDSGVLTGYALTNADDTSENKKMKFTYQVTGTTIQTADFDQTTFNDYQGSNGPLPFMLTGHDNLGDFQRRRQAPVVTMFAKRTETGYTSTGSGFDPDNESSNLMTAYWDWTDDAVSNKIGNQQETYRHVRQFVPAGTTDVDGYPVVVTRNKVRGRGRVLQLRFDGATDKDSHLLGFSVNYKVSRNI